MDYQQSWQGAQSGAQDRAGFVRQVYLWLLAGFAVAFAGAFGALASLPWLASIGAGRGFMWLLFGGQMGAIFFAQAVRRKRPLNLLAYGVFTGVSGYIAGLVSVFTAASSGAGVVMMAAGLTAVAFLTLSGIAFVTKRDFSFLGQFVIIGIAVMFFGGLAAAIFNMPLLRMVVSGVAVVACSGKLLWDTSAMLRTDDLSDPVGFALSLFVSLYNIFIALLNILGGARRR